MGGIRKIELARELGTKERADNLELRNTLLAGGSDEERTLRLVDTIAIHAWWEIQRCSPWGLEAGISDLSGIKDPITRYQIRDLIVGRDELLATRIREVVASGLNGGELSDVPWRETKIWRDPKSDVVAARAKMADEAV